MAHETPAAGNIWYVHPYAGGPGVGRYSRPYALARQWNGLGARTTVFTAANHHQLDAPRPPGPHEIGGVQYEFIPCRPYSGNSLSRLLNMMDATLSLRRHGSEYVARHGRPDVVISSSPHPYMFLAAHALARRFGAASIFEVRDLWPLSFKELLGIKPYHPLVLFTGWLERYAYTHAAATVSLLPLTKPYMLEHGLTAEKWHYVPNGVESDPAPLTDVPEPDLPACIAMAQTLKQAGRTVIAYTGGIGEPNNVESLLRAVHHCLAHGMPDIAAVIVGRGERKAAVEALRTELGLEDAVHIFEQVPKRAAIRLLDEVDMGYISLKVGSLFRFGISPNKIFDYMLAGLPIISSIDAGNDPVREAGCGVSVPSGQVADIAAAIGSVARLDAASREAMGVRGRQYVLSNHSYAQLARRYLDVMNELLRPQAKSH